MKFDELYRAVIQLYRENNSINQTSQELGISTVKARRILITEGLWSSNTSLKVKALYKQGLSTEEIARELSVSVKNVQAYIPYSRGTYGAEETSDSVRSSRYRNKKQFLAAASPIAHAPESESDGLEPIYREPITIPEESLQLELGRSTPAAPKPKESLILQLELEAPAEQSISRTVMVPGDLTLHSLHYLICKAFGLLNVQPYRFTLTGGAENRFKELLPGQWERYRKALFSLPKAEISADRFCDDDYDGRFSLKSWLQQKYLQPVPYYCASESWLWQNSSESIPDEGTKFHSDNRTPEQLPLLERLRLSEILTTETSIPSQSLFAADLSAAITRAEETLNRLENSQKKLLMVYLKQYQEYYNEIYNLKQQSPGGRIDPSLYPLLKEYGVRIEELRRAIWPALEALNPRLEPFACRLQYFYGLDACLQIRITCIKKLPQKTEKPLCLAAEGPNLTEDCEGHWGFAGRKSKPENIL